MQTTWILCALFVASACKKDDAKDKKAESKTESKDESDKADEARDGA
jgi:hypothetical protein